MMGTGRTFEQAFEENFMGEAELFIGVVELFHAQYKSNLDKLKAAIEKEDRVAVKELAHKIKGSVSHFHHEAPVEIAQQLEHQSKAMPQGLMQSEFAKLEQLLDVLDAELLALSAKMKVQAA